MKTAGRRLFQMLNVLNEKSATIEMKNFIIITSSEPIIL